MDPRSPSTPPLRRCAAVLAAAFLVAAGAAHAAVIFSQDCPDGGGDGICDTKNNCVALASRVTLDADGDGVVGIPDFGILSQQFGQPPGPSGLACAGSGELCTGP